jgi:hypothetical protein
MNLQAGSDRRQKVVPTQRQGNYKRQLPHAPGRNGKVWEAHTKLNLTESTFLYDHTETLSLRLPQNSSIARLPISKWTAGHPR